MLQIFTGARSAGIAISHSLSRHDIHFVLPYFVHFRRDIFQWNSNLSRGLHKQTRELSNIFFGFVSHYLQRTNVT